MDLTPYLYIPFVTWALAQTIKFSLSLVRGEVDLRYLYASGGMPSVHSAVVCSLATWALLDGGIASPLFGVTAVFAAIVMYDSFGVRRSTGEQARTLNSLVADLAKNGSLRNLEDYSKLREILGHKPLEVIVGAVLGTVVALVIGYEKIPTLTAFALQAPSSLVVKILAATLVGVLILSGIVYYVVAKKVAHSKQMKKQNARILFANIVFVLITGVYCFFAYERVAMYSAYYMLAIIAIAWLGVLAALALHQLNLSKTTKKIDSSRKDEWLMRAGKKKK